MISTTRATRAPHTDRLPALTVACREIPDAEDLIRTYCGLPAEDGTRQVWEYEIFDARRHRLPMPGSAATAPTSSSPTCECRRTSLTRGSKQQLRSARSPRTSG